MKNKKSLILRFLINFKTRFQLNIYLKRYSGPKIKKRLLNILWNLGVFNSNNNITTTNFPPIIIIIVQIETFVFLFSSDYSPFLHKNKAKICVFIYIYRLLLALKSDIFICTLNKGFLPKRDSSVLTTLIRRCYITKRETLISLGPDLLTSLNTLSQFSFKT